MTRELRARWLALATAVMVVVLAALFAWLRNLPSAPPATPGETAADRTTPQGQAATGVEAGRAAFERMQCTGCHAAQGRGNAALPLDGIGARLDRDELHARAFALGSAGAAFPPAVASLKRARADEPDVDPLLDYLEQLR